MRAEIGIDLYRPGDEVPILDLFERVFNKKRNEAYWRWENLGNPRGASIFSLVKEDGRVHGHLSLNASLFTIQDREIPAGQRMNFMLDASYRQKGFYKGMFEKLVQQARDRGWAFTFGFPNAAALKALQKIQPAVEVAQIPRFIKFYRGEPIASRKIRQPILSKTAGLGLDVLLKIKNHRKAATENVVALERFDERFDRLWQQVSPSLTIAAVRDQAYLNWRYIESPVDYRVLAYIENEAVLGYVVLLQETEGMGHIVDLLALEEKRVVPSLLSAVDAYMRPRCDMLSCWCLDQGQVSRHLSRFGFFNLPSLNTLAVSWISGTEELAQVLWDKNNWYVMIGDSDYV